MGYYDNGCNDCRRDRHDHNRYDRYDRYDDRDDYGRRRPYGPYRRRRSFRGPDVGIIFGFPRFFR